jgi:phage tail sheath protein FI
MPEYLAPGVYVEELASNAHPVEGVPTSTAGFVGAAHSGPTDTPVGPITSLVEFGRQFGDGSVMDFEGLPPTPCFLFAAAQAFFREGGKRLWIARIARAGSGADGARPQAEDFERGLSALDTVQDITIIAAPGATYGAGGTFADDGREISARLIAHAETTGNRFAILECPDGLDVARALEWRAAFSTNFAAVYFPWIYLTTTELMPPAGTVAGVFARVDLARGVWHAPANEVVQATAGRGPNR